MNRSRKLTVVALLVVLGAGPLTACGSDSSEEPRSMSTNSVIDGGPTSGIRSQAASQAPSSVPTSAPEVTDRQTEMASPAGEAVGREGATASAEPKNKRAKSPDHSASCGSDDAQTAIDKNIMKAPSLNGTKPVAGEWTVEDSDGYDACATLSWVTLIGGGSGSSIRQQMLFHYGDYLGTTTAEPIGFHPATVRLTDSSIRVTYTYTKDGESNAEASGRAVSTYTWNPDTESIDHAGEWPPGIG
ncbi:LppP/LprE family lipoprotein [Kocuria tytonis]|uniref:LppP/LprE family lipoprotein n=1 Tax=Kocuria tytonis TaxID=2054280 RepID=A0A495ABE3_9MICC|nr:LppP/LprE family lipoprotein [Kocuria tytonis]RKQ36820.1 LppP/LprE family lipoprotein [Kocuria tytonis]